MRARDLGIVVGVGRPGPLNALTDVDGVAVGHCSIVRGDGPLVTGIGPVRTGVTVVDPTFGRDIWSEPLFAGVHRLNGYGDLIGSEFVRETGTLASPIGITNCHSMGVVRDALLRINVEQLAPGQAFSALPLVAETSDHLLNDTNGFHVTLEHVRLAWTDRSRGAVPEGNVGSGTGMVCHEFKGGIGTASRQVGSRSGVHTVGVLVQSNQGVRHRLTVNGAPVGAVLSDLMPDNVPAVASRDASRGQGSIVVIVATDAPFSSLQCQRLAQRAAMGIARAGGAGEMTSGDFVLAFSTANRTQSLINHSAPDSVVRQYTFLSDAEITPFYWATIEATEEAIVNSMVAAQTMTGRDGVTIHALPHDRLVSTLDRFGLRTLPS